MAEGRTTSYYSSDTLSMYDNAGAGQPAQFKVKEANNLVAQASVLGWHVADATLPTNIGLPRGLTPRHVIGIGSNGKRYRAIVADVTATIWDRSTSTWTIVDNFGATITVTRTGLVAEHSTG